LNLAGKRKCDVPLESNGNYREGPVLAQSCRSRACPIWRRRLNRHANGVSRCWGRANCKVSRLLPNATAKSVAAFETFVSVACCRLGLLMSPSVHQYTIGNSRLVLNRKDTRIPAKTRTAHQNPCSAVLPLQQRRSCRRTVDRYCGPLQDSSGRGISWWIAGTPPPPWAATELADDRAGRS
jgi:hypothetical protein